MSPRKLNTPDVLGILPLQEAVLFPNTVIPLAVVKKPGIRWSKKRCAKASRSG